MRSSNAQSTLFSSWSLTSESMDVGLEELCCGTMESKWAPIGQEYWKFGDRKTVSSCCSRLLTKTRFLPEARELVKSIR